MTSVSPPTPFPHQLGQIIYGLLNVVVGLSAIGYSAENLMN